MRLVFADGVKVKSTFFRTMPKALNDSDTSSTRFKSCVFDVMIWGFQYFVSLHVLYFLKHLDRSIEPVDFFVEKHKQKGELV